PSYVYPFSCKSDCIAFGYVTKRPPGSVTPRFTEGDTRVCQSREFDYDVCGASLRPRLFLYPCLLRVRDVLGPRPLKDGLGPMPLGTIVGMDGDQNVAFLDFPLVPLGLIFRNA